MDSRSSRSRSASTKPRARPQKSKSARAGARHGTVAAGSQRKTHGRSPEIIDAAARVFAERGYHGASTQDIADVLGIRQASLYYYFRSKEAALEIVCARGVEDFYKAAKAIATGPGTPREKLTSLIRAHVTPNLDRRDFVKVFLTQRQFLSDERRRRIGKLTREIEQLFEVRDSPGRAQRTVQVATQSAPDLACHPGNGQFRRPVVRQGSVFNRADR